LKQRAGYASANPGMMKSENLRSALREECLRLSHSEHFVSRFTTCLCNSVLLKALWTSLDTLRTKLPICITMVFSRYLPHIAAFAALVVVTVEAGRFGASQRSPSTRPANTVQRLHEVLSISNDPNEDIRTNVLLNMEGI